MENKSRSSTPADSLSPAPLSKPTVFSGSDMHAGISCAVGGGTAIVFSTRCPGKASPNEDCAAVIPCSDNSCILTVADGMGGARAGEEASKLAIHTLVAAVEKAQKSGRELRDAILDGFELANRRVCELGMGAGTTLAAVHIQGELMRSFHVGDSRVLAVGGKGKVKHQTIAHSPVGYGLHGGFLDESEALQHEDRHLVSNFVGRIDMHIAVGPLQKIAQRDTILLSTDGLCDNLEMGEIVARLCKGSIDAAVEALVSICHRRMNGSYTLKPSKPDDLTFILFRPQLVDGGRGERRP